MLQDREADRADLGGRESGYSRKSPPVNGSVQRPRQRGEIAGAHRGGWNDDLRLDGRLTQPRALVREEEKGLVAAVVDLRDPYRTAEGGAELIALQSVGLLLPFTTGAKKFVAFTALLRMNSKALP